jgi:copper chaperone NosL
MNHLTRCSAGVLWLTAVLALALTACGTAADAEPTPPTIHYGEDICEFCGMIVSEERHAAAYVTEDGHGHSFDDIGDMVQAHLATQEAVVALFVHDYQEEAWIRAETAHYVQSDKLTTPMASGLAAFTSSEEAQALAADLQGKVLTFDELLTQYRQMAPMTMGDEGEHNSHDQ